MKNKEALLLLFVAIGIIACGSPYEVYTNIDELLLTLKTLQPRIIELDGINIIKQPTSTTCGITTVTIVSNFYNNTDYDANDLARKYNVNTARGSNNNDMIKWLQGELPGRIIVYKSNVSNEEMIRDIHSSLNNNNPIVINFGAPNPFNEPYYDFHVSVVYGINLENETIIIANTYGYREEISLIEFLNRMSYTEIHKYPPVQRFNIIRNRQDRNAYFLIK